VSSQLGSSTVPPTPAASVADIWPPTRWIASTVTNILGNEDDVVIELIFNLIEGGRHVGTRHRISRKEKQADRNQLQPDIKSLQIQLTGFLDKDTASFCKDLWKLLLSAQDSPQGVPKELLEAKKQELLQEKVHPPVSMDNCVPRC
jgi:serine/arginine repetitive matrix protein 1